MEANIHKISIEAKVKKVVPEIIRWGEAPWWPKNCQMRFERLTAPGPVAKGTRYRQSVLLPFAPSWSVEVERVTDSSITRSFLDGMFTGFETVSVKPDRYDALLTYEMHFRLNGMANKILWRLAFRRMHNANIEAILASLKRYCENE